MECDEFLRLSGYFYFLDILTKELHTKHEFSLWINHFISNNLLQFYLCNAKEIQMFDYLQRIYQSIFPKHCIWIIKLIFLISLSSTVNIKLLS